MNEADKAWALINAGRGAEALPATSRLVQQPNPSVSALAAHAAALKMAGRLAEAAPFNRQAVDADPTNALSWCNLGGVLCDLGIGGEAEAAVRKAMELGLNAPEASRMLGAALLIQQRYEEAESWMRDALRSERIFHAAIQDLCEIIWMRSGDLALALEPLDDALRSAPADGRLFQLRAMVQQYGGDIDGANRSIQAGLAADPSSLILLLAGARLAAEYGPGAAALDFAARALRLAPDNKLVGESYAMACLAAGSAAQASEMTGRLLRANPHDQLALALQAQAWRMLGDDRYRRLYDYEAFVRPYIIDTPPGWKDLPAFLADLTRVLVALHRSQAHPLLQSLRHGSQVHNLHRCDDPVVRAFFESADKAVARYVQEVGRGDDPLRARSTGKTCIHSAWSVSLRPTGFHVNHFHPKGWLSSAFYVETPAQALDSADREGWIKFGEPLYQPDPPLPPEHFVRPEPGKLVLFPSYMWHGTVPFTSDERRLSVAFDVVPA